MFLTASNTFRPSARTPMTTSSEIDVAFAIEPDANDGCGFKDRSWKALLPRNRSPGSLHEGLHLLQSEAAIFVGIHCLEDSFVSRLKFLQ